MLLFISFWGGGPKFNFIYGGLQINKAESPLGALAGRLLAHINLNWISCKTDSFRVFCHFGAMTCAGSRAKLWGLSGAAPYLFTVGGQTNNAANSLSGPYKPIAKETESETDLFQANFNCWSATHCGEMVCATGTDCGSSGGVIAPRNYNFLMWVSVNWHLARHPKTKKINANHLPQPAQESGHKKNLNVFISQGKKQGAKIRQTPAESVSRSFDFIKF